ncbi:serine/threonine-protein kinase Nek11-like [Discoglossus pictus]
MADIQEDMVVDMMDVTVDTHKSSSRTRSCFSSGSLISGRYTVHQKLGIGSFATAYLVTDAKDEGTQKVLKRISCNGLRPDTTLPSAREAKLLGSLRHPFIVRYLGSFLATEDFCIITEYCEGGDLHTCIQQQQERGCYFSEKNVMEWLIQLLLGVNYLHERLVLHRDLKTKNIFLKNGTVKIGDFGVSRILSVPSDMASTFTGTPHYMSPEVFTHSGYNSKSDIWSLGCILYEMCTYRRAFDSPNWMKLATHIVEGPSPSLPPRYSTELNDIVQRTLRKVPEERPSAGDILRLPIVAEHGKALSTWLQEVLNQDREESVCEDAARIAAAVQEKVHLDSLRAMQQVQGMHPRQRRRIRKEEKPETYMKKMQRAVERLYLDHQKEEQSRRNVPNSEEDILPEDATQLSKGDLKGEICSA